MTIQDVAIGSKVIYWSIIKRNGLKSNPLSTTITSEAFEIGGEIFCTVQDITRSIPIRNLELVKRHGKS